MVLCFFFFQAEDGIRDLVRSRGLGDVYKRQVSNSFAQSIAGMISDKCFESLDSPVRIIGSENLPCLLYTSDAADERSSVDLGGRRIIKKKNSVDHGGARCSIKNRSKCEHIKTQQEKHT